MSISELRSFRWRGLVLVLGCLAGAAALRCAPPGQCLHMSDCASGETCLEGACHNDLGDVASASDAEAGSASDAPVTDAPAVDRAAPADSAPIVDSATGDEDEPADADASPDATDF